MNHENSHETTPETAVDGLAAGVEGADTRDGGSSADALELLKLKAALRMGYSGEHAITLAGLLNGATADEIESSATDVIKTLRSITVDRPVDKSQGYGLGESHRPTTFADMLNID